MTLDNIIRIAREAGLEKYHLPDSMMEYEFDRCIERFAGLVAAAEREECAKLADAELDNNAMLMSMPPKSAAAFKIASSIRARGRA